MVDLPFGIALFIFILGILIATSMWIKTFSLRFQLSPIAGYILLGTALRFFNDSFALFSTDTYHSLELLGEIGLIMLLFKTGLECDLKSIAKHFKQATFIAFFDVLGSGILVFFASYYLLNLSLIPALFIAGALTATSIGVAVGVWENTNAIRKKEGRLLLSLAALDDIGGIIIMALLLEVAPIIHAANDYQLAPIILHSSLLLALKFGGFVLFCIIFSKFIEPFLMKILKKYEPEPDRLISVITNALIIAAISSMMGFGLPIGAFFAGIAFSHDKEIKKMRHGLSSLENFFIPFFFINIGYIISIGTINSDLIYYVSVFLAVAVLSKLIVIYFPSVWEHLTAKGAALLAISMIPRAEVTLVILQAGALLGPWAIPSIIYNSIVIVALFTCLFTPLVLYPMIKKYEAES